MLIDTVLIWFLSPSFPPGSPSQTHTVLLRKKPSERCGSNIDGWSPCGRAGVVALLALLAAAVATNPGPDSFRDYVARAARSGLGPTAGGDGSVCVPECVRMCAVYIYVAYPHYAVGMAVWNCHALMRRMSSHHHLRLAQICCTAIKYMTSVGPPVALQGLR